MDRARILHRQYAAMARTGRWLGRQVRPAGWLMMAMTLMVALPGSDPGRGRSYQLFALAMGLLVLEPLSLAGFRPRGRAERRLPSTCVPGVPVTIEVTVFNSGRRAWRGVRLVEEAPLAMPDADEFAANPEPGEAARNPFDRFFIYYRFAWLGERRATFRSAESEPFDLAPGAGHRATLTLLPLRRGHLELGRLRLARDSAFGFFRKSRPLAAPPARVPVVPRAGRPAAPESGNPSPRSHPAGPAPRHRSGQSDEFLTLRDYRPGDPLQHIHWATFARAGHPVVREFEDIFRPRVAAILDTQLPAAGRAFELTRAFEEMVEEAAALAAAMESGETLLELLLVQDRAHTFTSGPGHLHLRRILEILAAVQPGRAAGLAALERLALGHAAAFQSAVFFSVQWDEDRRRLLDRLRARGLDLRACIAWPHASAPPPAAPPWVRFSVPRRPAKPRRGLLAALYGEEART
jgi:uncharacterized protein (DUF58 family)